MTRKQKPEQQLRVWDRVGDVLCERQLDPTPAPQVPSLLLALDWVLAPADGLPCTLRLALGGECHELLPTRTEARKAETEARKAAEARVLELEAALRKAGH